MDAVQFGGRERGPQPIQVLVTGVGQGNGAAGEHRRGDLRLAQTAFGHADEGERVRLQQGGNGLGVPPHSVDVYP